MSFKKWVKSIQTAGYNGARTVVGRAVFANSSGIVYSFRVDNKDNVE